MQPKHDNLNTFLDALKRRTRTGQVAYSGILPEEDHFFGKTGDLIARFIPGLTVVGKDGRRTPVFKTNFRMKSRNLTGWQLLTAEQNAKAMAAIADKYEPFGTDNMERLIRGLAERFGGKLPG